MKNTGSKSEAAILRQRAEEVLKKKTLKTGSQPSEADTQKLLYELEVHQIELEMQNEELMMAKEQAEVASEKYLELYDFAPTGYFTLSKEGKIIELNFNGANMLGKERLNLKNAQFGFFVSDETKPIYNLFLGKVFSGKVKESCDVTLSTNVNFAMYVHLIGIAAENEEQCLVTVIDITGRRQVEKRQELAGKILLILNSQNTWQLLINDILFEIKNYTGMDAVGIRLKEGDDFPYYETQGFPENFVQAEKYLCTRNEKGEIVYDDKGKPCLECMCGTIISGRADPSLSYFTKAGSFYANNTTKLLYNTSEKERQSATRNRCNAEGYESVALIPLYSNREIIGLLQLNDKRPDMFSLEMIQFFEKTGHAIGIAIHRIQNENKIKESEKNLKKQNTKYLNLNKEYTLQNKELAESLKHIQNINHELVEAKGKAEESDKLKSAFLTNISHEIRTPMNAIMGFSEFLLQPGLSHEKVENYVQIINTSSLQLLSVISDIIDISQIEANQICINKELVDINKLLDDLFITYKKVIELKKLGLYYSSERPNDLIQINTDGNRIKQVLCNLLNNAIKFTKKGKIEFGYKTKKNFIEFYVKDTGIGIAPEEREYIFQRFRQVETRDSRKYGGNGLGLSISKALVEKLGGTIAVNSELEKGSTFVFTIPYSNNIENIRSPQQTSKTDQFMHWKDKTILIVEDEINNHEYIKELLAYTNVVMLHAWDGKEAVEHVKNNPDISLVLMDIKMSAMDGYEATRHIKLIRPKLPVIAQTAYVYSQDKEQALKAGFDDYITKPVNRDLFMQLVNKHLS